MEAGGLTMVELISALKKDALDQDKIVAIVADLIEKTVNRNDKMQRISPLELFEGDKAPVKASSYVKRIMKYGGLSPCCFIVGMIYLDRLKEIIPSLCLTSTNFQRLFLVSVMEAAKFLDDFYFSNKHWAEVGGITTEEINALELEFLFLLEFDVNVQRDEYDWYLKCLNMPRELHAVDNQGMFGFPERGHISTGNRSSSTIHSYAPNDRVLAGPNDRGLASSCDRATAGPNQPELDEEHLAEKPKVHSFSNVADASRHFSGT
eukprot:CAMPEP_0172185896 /NCGR_PEP_ID=MMETSP1050-20130122/20429_1 /TAXON_ID=233186 /ORGANISM="Cryptomonas curvata, Strain CCAP979/52" /LENGTH=262 /DNA_ID=CAMNT_0012859943 /DNA_START=129 /DNA_END=917 /DNA_ORIENTATION=+